MNTVRTETRIIRPFSGLSGAQDLLDNLKLRQGSRTYSPGTVVLPSAKLREQSFSIVVDAEEQDFIQVCKQAKIDSDKVTLYVYANSRTLRKSTIILDIPISQAKRIPKEIEIQDEFGDELSRYVFLDSNGFQLNVALVLNSELEPKALKIHKVGTFLARTSFTIKPEEQLTSFAPEPLTDALRKDFELPKNCMTYVYVSESVLSTEDLSETVTVYLDTDILNLLHLDEGDEVSKHIQTNLAIQTIETIIYAIINGLREDGRHFSELAENSAAVQFLNKLSADLGLNSQDLSVFAENDPSRLRSLLEGRFKLQNLVESMLKRSQ